MAKKVGDETLRGIGHSRTFKKHVHLSVVKRQKDKSFLNLLKRIRNGKITKKDWKKLLTRNPQVVKKPDDYDSIIRLFGRNASVHDFNQRRLQQAVKNQIPIFFFFFNICSRNRKPDQSVLM